MKNKIFFGIGIPTTAAMKDELKKIANIKDFLKRNKKDMIDGNLTDHLIRYWLRKISLSQMWYAVPILTEDM